MRALWRWVPALLWAAAIFALSAQPDLPRAPLSLLDLLLKKSAHLAEYAVLAVLLHHALGPLSRGQRARLALAWALAVLYAVSDEVHQSFVPGRTATPVDVVVDGVGALLGLALRMAARQWRATRAAARAG
jgi:VanZ family protein